MGGQSSRQLRTCKRLLMKQAQGCSSTVEALGMFPAWGDPVVKPEIEAGVCSLVRIEPHEEPLLSRIREGGFRRQEEEELRELSFPCNRTKLNCQSH